MTWAFGSINKIHFLGPFLWMWMYGEETCRYFNAFSFLYGATYEQSHVLNFLPLEAINCICGFFSDTTMSVFFLAGVNP